MSRAPTRRKEPESLREWLARTMNAAPVAVPLDLGERTDLGNAERLVDAHRTRIRFCGQRGGWILYDGVRWRRDEDGGALRLQIGCAREYKNRVLALPEDERKPLLAFADRSLSRKGLDDALAVARALPGVAVAADAFDADPFLLNVLNGTLDLRTGDLLTHDPARMQSRLCPVHWDPEAECPDFQAFLRRVVPSESVRRFLARYAGYSLSGDTGAHCMVFLHGSGRNGKSTLVETLKHVMGDYAKPLRSDALMHKRQMDAGAYSELAGLVGVRMTVSVETEEGVGLNEALIKGLTGGEELVAKLMHQDTFRFQPQFKMWMSGNHKPNVRGTDDGIWERVRLVPFDVQIPAEERDPELGARLRKEAPGILRWAVEGGLEYLVDGLGDPEEVRAATEAYRGESDPIGLFLDERTETGPEHATTVDALYVAYAAWCRASGMRERTKIDFSRKLADAGRRRGFEKRKTMGMMLVPGLGLRDSGLPVDPFA